MGGKHKKSHLTPSADLDFPSVGDCFTGSLTSSAATINEGAAVTYTATLTGGTSATPLSIPYTLSGTGITPADFGGTALTGNINIAAGATTGTLTLNATNDLTTEGTENLTVTLGAAAGVNLGTAVTSTAIADTSTTPVPGGTTTTNLSATALTGTATAGNDTFNIASGTYTATIANFGQTGADKIALFAGAATTVVSDVNQTDGIQQLSVADAGTGSTTTITLTGLTPAQDAGVFNTASFNTIFGAGSLV
jgi:hypothetical protein